MYVNNYLYNTDNAEEQTLHVLQKHEEQWVMRVAFIRELCA